MDEENVFCAGHPRACKRLPSTLRTQPTFLAVGVWSVKFFFMEFYRNVLPEYARQLLSVLGAMPFLQPTYLAGGTGLALQLGHRISADLDFFFPEEFDVSLAIQKLSAAGKFRLTKKSEQTVIGTLDEVKLALLGYRYPILFPLHEMSGIHVAGTRDIACMKIDAIAGRGAKRDFIDLFFILKEIAALSDILGFFGKKYAALQYNMVHVKKSLVYFADAEEDPMPQMLQPASWDEVKKYLEREVLLLS